MHDPQFHLILRVLKVLAQQNDTILDLLADNIVKPAQMKSLRLKLESHRKELEDAIASAPPPTPGV